MNSVLRVLLVLWIVGYIAIACAPLLADNLSVGFVGFIGGVILVVPWLIGLAVLSALIWLTNVRREG